MATNTFLENIVSVLGNEYASVVEDGLIGQVSTYIDTGSYALNALLCGSIYGGFPSNKTIMLAGDPSVGKTYFAMSFMADFLSKNPTGQVVFFESEGALSLNMFKSRKMDTSRILVVPVATVQQFRTQAARVLESYKKMKNRPPMMMVLDSLGMLSTSKEIGDAKEGEDTRDMTRAQLIRGAFRILSLEMGVLNVPLIMTNHVSDTIGSYVPTKTTGGGKGGNYAASTVLMISKTREKDGSLVVGNTLKITLAKSRFTREGLQVETSLSYENGLSRYHGLLDFALAAGIWSKEGKFIKIGEEKTFESRIYADPEKYFTPATLDMIDTYTKSAFMFGSEVPATVEETGETDDEAQA